MKKRMIVLCSMFVLLLAACGDDSSSSAANSPDILYQTSEGLIYSDYTVRDEFGKIIGLFDASTNEIVLKGGTIISLGEDDLIAVSSSSEKITEQSSSSFTGNVVDNPNWAYLNPDIDYGTFKDIRDGQVYKTVKIGTQTWMAENLNYSDSVRTPSLKERSWCYENSADSCAKYGRLYTWAAAIDSVGLLKNNLLAEGDTCGDRKTCTLPEKVQGICPEGWHLPTNSEWEVLYDYIDNDQGLIENTVGTYLRSPVGWKAYDGIPVGKDTYGFSALPAGYRFDNGFFGDAGGYANFWSATEYNSLDAYRRDMDYRYEYFYNYYDNKNYAYSVRCLKD